jgi:hypothetical protein
MREDFAKQILIARKLSASVISAYRRKQMMDDIPAFYFGFLFATIFTGTVM